MFVHEVERFQIALEFKPKHIKKNAFNFNYIQSDEAKDLKQKTKSNPQILWIYNRKENGF